MFDELKRIYLNRKTEEIVPFLKKLTAKDRKELQPRLQDLLGMGNFRHGEEPIFFAVALVCCNKTQFKNLTRWAYYGGFEIYNEILDWHNPDWFSGFVNEQYDGHPVIPYHLLAEWEEKSYISLLPGTIARALTERSVDMEKYPVTLKEHIWYIFEYETTINWTDYHQKGSGSGSLFNLMEEGKIDRIRILKECLLTANRNFNKNLTGWFIDLFNELKPTDDELIQLQPELFAALSCPHSKPVNTVLSTIKRIQENPRFQTCEFISSSNILLSSEVKAVLTNTLSILDKIAKKEKNKREEICIQLVHVFLNKDETIQTKAAKLIAQYASPDSENLKMALLPYFDSILMSVRNLIREWMDDTEISGSSAPGNTIKAKRMPLIREDNRIPDIDSFEDFIFLSGQAFSNSEPYLFDQFTAALIRFAPQINRDNISQLEPAFLQAHKVIATWTSTIGFLDRLLAASFIAYVNHLIKQFPNETQALKQLNVKYKQNTFTPDNWKSSKMWNYIPYMDLLTFVSEKIKTGQTLPLLSTPTHMPGWIDPEILIKRLIQYQEAGKEPFPLDMELAIQRCALDHTEAALSLAQQSLQEEYNALFVYLLSGKAENVENTFNQHFWLTALLTRRDKDTYSVLKEKIGFSGKTIPDEHFSGLYNWGIQKKLEKRNVYDGKTYQPKEEELKIFRIRFPEYSFDMSKGLFYEYCFFKYGDLSYDWGMDKVRFIASYPNNHEALLSKIIQSVFLDYGPPNVKTIADIFTVIHQLNTPLSEMECLFFASCMLHANKTVRTIAADIWSQKIMDQTVDSAKIGKSIGYMIAEEFLPLKRFTDLAMNNMLGIDRLHNQELFRMVEAIHIALEGKAITNIKKLQEIYNELKALNN